MASFIFSENSLRLLPSLGGSISEIEAIHFSRSCVHFRAASNASFLILPISLCSSALISSVFNLTSRLDFNPTRRSVQSDTLKAELILFFQKKHISSFPLSCGIIRSGYGGCRYRRSFRRNGSFGCSRSFGRNRSCGSFRRDGSCRCSRNCR